MMSMRYSVVSIRRTGSLNYFEVFYHPEHFFHALNEIFLPPWSFFHALNEIFAPPCSLITSCSLNRYYRVDVSLYQYFHSPGILIQFVAKIPICKHKVCLFFTHDFSTKGLHHAPAINESAFWYFAAFYCLCLTLTYYQGERSLTMSLVFCPFLT